MEEMLPFLRDDMDHKVLDFGLHINPKKLHSILQDDIDDSGGQYATIILGYGLCSLAVIGLKANGCRLVIPRLDDCIAIFLGSRTAYTAECTREPGTYFLTKGWMEVGDTPFLEYERSVKKYGQIKAWKIYQAMMGKYKRLALIKTGQGNIETYQVDARVTAEKFGLNYEELIGSDQLVRKLLQGPWDHDIVVIEPGGTCTLGQFLPVDDLGKK
jgi:hypothetical protein